jgi:hypothetical protein
MPDLSLADAVGLACARIEEDREAHIEQLRQAAFGAIVALRLAGVAFMRGDLLEAAKRIREACDREYEALGDSEHCGAIEEQIRRAHVGDDADDCGEEGCEICAALSDGPLAPREVSS